MTPTYTITHKLLENVVKIESEKSLLGDRELTQNLRDKYRGQEYSLNIFHLAHLLGMELTLRDAEKLAEQRKLEIDPMKERIIHNFRNAMDFSRSNMAANYAEVDPDLILHLNKILLAGWKDAWDAKVREPGEWADAQLDTIDGKGVDGHELASEMAKLRDWFQLEGSRLNPVIRNGLLIARLWELKPFLFLNEVTVLAVADMLWCRQGFAGRGFQPSTAIFDVYKSELQAAWELSTRAHDYTNWLEVFSTAWAREIGELRSNVDRELTEEKEKNVKQPFLDLNQRQLKILRYLQTIPTVQREDYCQMMEVSTMTAYRDMNELVEKKLLRVDGQGRGTKYMLVTR